MKTMSEISKNSEIPVTLDFNSTDNSGSNAGPDIVGYLKFKISEIINQPRSPTIHNSEKGMVSQTNCGNLTEEIEKNGGAYRQNQHILENGHNSARMKCLFEGGVGVGLEETQKERLKNYLKESVAIMNAEVDEVTQQVFQVSHMRTVLKRKRSRAVISSKSDETEKTSKKQRMLFLARSEAAHRRSMADILRQFGSILKQITQHKWCWPFTRPVDVAGLSLRDYYDVIKRPMDLGSIRDRMELNDGSGYSNVREIYEDVRLVFRNAMTYNKPGTEVYMMAKALLEKFEEKWRSILEPKLIELEAKREEQGSIDIGGQDSEIALQKYSDVVFEKLNNIEQQLEDFLGAATSNSRPLSVTEKKELVNRIQHLPSTGLNRIVEIIAQRNHSYNVSAEEIRVDLDNEDPSTLWRLYIYLQTVTNASDSVDNS